MHESAEVRHLSDYRQGLIVTAGEGGQVALDFDRAWGEAAAEALEQLAADGLEFTADDLLQPVGQPSSPGAVGGVFKKSAKADLITCVGVTTSRASGALALPQHADQHRPKRPILLAVDQEFGR